MAKGLSLLLDLNYYNMGDILRHIDEVGFTPFSDSDYATAALTPEPLDDLKPSFKLVDGKWV